MAGWEDKIWEDPAAFEAAIRIGAIAAPPRWQDRYPGQPRILYAYLDESFAEGHFYVAGFVVEGPQYQRLIEEIQTLMQDAVAPQFGIPWETELHGNEIMQGKVGWKCLRGKVGDAIWVYESALSVLKPINARTFIQGVDTHRLHRRYGVHAHSPYIVTLRHALERIDAYAKVHNFDRVQVVADYRDNQKIYHEALAGYKRTGTPGYQRSMLTRTAEPISFEDSRASYGLQMADLIAYISRRHLEADASMSRNSRRAAARLYGYVWERVAGQNQWRTKWVP